MNDSNIDTGLDSSIEKIKVIMVVDKLKKKPTYPLKSGYSFQYFQDGDKNAWINIQYQVGHFDSLEAARERFDREFNGQESLLKKRLLFVVDQNNNKVATAMLWFSEFEKKQIDRLHWIATLPKHQGQRLTHAMLSELLKDYPKDKKLYLTSQTWSYRAISIYYRFGFIPYPLEDIKPYFNNSLKDIENLNFQSKTLKRAWDLINEKII